MDTMAYLTYKALGLPKNRVIGMGGALDTARFKYYLSKEMKANPNEVHCMVFGGHGDTTMLPLVRFASYKGRQVADILDKETIDQVVKNTMVGGATLTSYLGTSAWYAPGAAVAYLVRSIVHDKKKIIPCSVYLDGEYGQSDIFLGVPIVVGENGVEEIIDYKLNAEESALFEKGAQMVRETNNVLKELKVI